MVAVSPSSKSSSRPCRRAEAPPPNFVKPIVLRGKTILCRYLRSSPTLAFVADKPDFKSLEWVLGELKKDLATEGTKRTRQEKETSPEEEQQIIKEILEMIKEHENCSRAWFIGARSTIKVRRSDKRLKEFNVKAIKKTRQQALFQQDLEGWRRLRAVFLAAAHEALAFLEEKAPTASSAGGPHEEPRGPPVEPKSEADDESLDQ